MEWINVIERMPPDKVEVLAFVKCFRRGNEIRKTRVVAWYNSSFDYWENLSNVDMEVTHWMRLPEPPK